MFNKKKSKDDKVSPIVLSKSEKVVLIPYVDRLRNLMVYESTEIKAILKKIKFGKSANLQKWKGEIDNVLYAMYEEKYIELLGLAK